MMEDDFTKEGIEFLEKTGILKRFPDWVYKYYRIDDNFLKSITGNYFWFSKPTSFNDPFDARLLVNTKSSLAEIKKYYGSLPDEKKREEMTHFFVSLQKKDPQLLTKHINALNLQYFENFGICCFTTKNNNLLMWAHYSDNHKGVCIKYNRLVDEKLFTDFHPVQYSKKYPKINFIKAFTDSRLRELFLTKSIDWKYEDEWRILRTNYDGHDENYNFLSKNYGEHLFAKQGIEEVLFGCKTTDDNITKVIDRFKENNYTNVVFKKAETVDFKFDLNFTEIQRI